jgi:hypothetical protein
MGSYSKKVVFFSSCVLFFFLTSGQTTLPKPTPTEIRFESSNSVAGEDEGIDIVAIPVSAITVLIFNSANKEMKSMDD